MEARIGRRDNTIKNGTEENEFQKKIIKELQAKLAQKNDEEGSLG